MPSPDRLPWALIITALLYAVEHHLPLGLEPTARDIVTGHWKLKRLAAYVIGTVTFWIGLAIWLAPSPLFWWSCLFPVAAGLGDAVLGYGVDWFANVLQRARLFSKTIADHDEDRDGRE